MNNTANSVPATKKKRRPRKSGSGGRRRHNKPKRESTLAIIDRLLLTPVPTKLNDEKAHITTLEVILYQLLQKELAGDARAGRAILKYEELAKQNAKPALEVEFVDNDYTRSFVCEEPEDHNG